MGGFERHYQNRQLCTRIFRPQSLVCTSCRRATLSKRCSGDVHSSLAVSLSGVKYDRLAVRGQVMLAWILTAGLSANTASAASGLEWSGHLEIRRD